MYTKKQPVDHCSRSTVFELIGDWVFGCFIPANSQQRGVRSRQGVEARGLRDQDIQDGGTSSPGKWMQRNFVSLLEIDNLDNFTHSIPYSFHSS